MREPTVLSTASGSARAGTLPAVLTGVFITILDFFIVNVAIPSVQRDLHASAAAIEWVVAGYGLTYGAGLVLGGRLGDIFGRRRMFTVGLALFTLASITCGLAPDSAALVAARLAQGASAALLAPQVLAILRTTFSGPAQVRAISAYALTMGLAAVFGQVIGGLLINADLFGLGWRACFLINVPIGAAALVMAHHVVPESRLRGVVRLDIGGTVLVTLALAATLLPLIEGRERDWPLWAWFSFAVAMALFLAYGRRRTESPLIDLALFRERGFTVGLLTQLAFNMGMPAYFLIFALYAQDGRSLDALQAGLIFMPIGLGYLAASLLSGAAVARFGGGQVIAFGALTRALGLAALLVVTARDSSVVWLIPALVVDGFGMGLALPTIMGTVLARIAPHHAGAAAGALTTTQQVGGAIGVAIAGIVYYGSLSNGATEAFQSGLLYVIVAAVAVSVLAQMLPRTSPTA